MDESVSIPKNPDLKPSRDYNFLREAGLKHIEELSSDLWTDYNIHDPGITILELLCYAITDLGYRTDYDIKDLLADSSAPSPDDAKQFHSARNILTSDPVTTQDYRKLLIDIEGVKNAWLRPMEESSPPLYLNAEKGEWEQEPDDQNRRINLNGLYSITLELDEHEEYGDLNKYVFERELDSDVEGKDDAKLTVRLPGWSSWFNMGVRIKHEEQIDKIILNNLKSIDEGQFNFETVIEVETSDGQSYTQKVKKIEVTGKEEPPEKIKIKTQFEETILREYKDRLQPALQIGLAAYDRLHENRSLCEDYEEFCGLDVEEIGVCADIELESDAVLEKVLAEIYHRIGHHLAPPINFYSLKEMMDKGVPTEEIFEGPPLNHGFILTEELEKADIKKEIFVSDILQILMDVDGVKTVNNLMLNSAYGGEIQKTSIKWQHTVTGNRVPRFSREQSDIDLFKENLPYDVNTEKIDHYLKEMEDLQRKRKLSSDEDYDLPIPEGKDRGLTQYTSIQQHLPLTYGVGDTGIPGKVTDRRRAQAKQLRAYLTFYDQLLVNYLAQLANLKNLFSFSNNVSHTYSYQVLYDLPDDFEFPESDPGSEVIFSQEGSPRIYQVIKNFVDDLDSTIDIDNYSTLKSDWTTYRKNIDSVDHFVKQLKEIVEDKQTFQDRRNRILDHLLARFGESFTDYVMLMYSREAGPRTATELIEDKTDFLKNYPSISASRGSGFNYKNENEIWDTNNLSGFKKRVSRLLGIENYNRRTLICKEPDDLFEIYKDDAGEWRFRLTLESGNIALRSEGYTQKSNCDSGKEAAKEAGKDFENYERLRTTDERFYFNLKAKNGEIIGTSLIYDSEQERDRILATTGAALQGKCNKEGFHLIEHILLRPNDKGDPKLPVCAHTKGRACPGYSDPYSFRISLIVPYWPDRFRDMEFRRFMEKTIRRETPAHIHVKICWADKEDMENFEQSYRKWLKEKSKDNPDPDDLQKALKELIEDMKKIRSVYPKATLHDFEEDDDNPMLLDNIALGKPNKEYNEDD